MNAQEIKAAIASGKTVCWSNPGYKVVGKDLNNLIIFCASTKHGIGLTHSDGTTLNGKEEDFFILYQLPEELGYCYVKHYKYSTEFVGSIGLQEPGDETPDEYYMALERLCVAHAHEGIDISSKAYVQGLISTIQ